MSSEKLEKVKKMSESEIM